MPARGVGTLALVLITLFTQAKSADDSQAVHAVAGEAELAGTAVSGQGLPRAASTLDALHGRRAAQRMSPSMSCEGDKGCTQHHVATPGRGNSPAAAAAPAADGDTARSTGRHGRRRERPQGELLGADGSGAAGPFSGADIIAATVAATTATAVDAGTVVTRASVHVRRLQQYVAVATPPSSSASPAPLSMCLWSPAAGALSAGCYLNYVYLASQALPPPYVGTQSSMLLRLSFLAYNCTLAATPKACYATRSCVWNDTVTTAAARPPVPPAPASSSVPAQGACLLDQSRVIPEVASSLACPGMPFTTTLACALSADSGCDRHCVAPTAPNNLQQRSCLAAGTVSTEPFLRQSYLDALAAYTTRDFTVQPYQPPWFGGCPGGPLLYNLLASCRRLTNLTQCAAASPACAWFNSSAAYGCDITPTAFLQGVLATEGNTSTFAASVSSALSTCSNLGSNPTACNSFRNFSYVASRLDAAAAMAPLYGADPWAQLPEMPGYAFMPPAPPPGSSGGGGGLSTGDIVAIVICSVIGFFILLILAIWLIKKCLTGHETDVRPVNDYKSGPSEFKSVGPGGAVPLNPMVPAKSMAPAKPPSAAGAPSGRQTASMPPMVPPPASVVAGK